MQTQSTQPQPQSQNEFTSDNEPWKQLAAVLIEDAVKTLRAPVPRNSEYREKTLQRRIEARQWIERRAPELLEWVVPGIDSPELAIMDLLAEYEEHNDG